MIINLNCKILYMNLNDVTCIAGIAIFIIIVLIIIKYKFIEGFVSPITKENNAIKIDGFINTISSYQLDILKQSYQAYGELYDYFPFLATDNDPEIKLSYDNMKYLFTESVTDDIKTEILKIGSVKGYLGRLFLDLAGEGIFYIEAMPYIGMYIVLILGNRYNMYQTAINAFKMKYPPNDYDIVINNDYIETGILTFYFNSTYCAEKDYKMIEFNDLVDKENKNTIPKCNISTTSAPSTNLDNCCSSINIESLVNRLRSDAREWSTLTKTNIEAEMEFITKNNDNIGNLLTEYIYMIVLYKNGTSFNTLDTDFNITHINNEIDKKIFKINLKLFNKLINKQTPEMKKFITNYVDNYNVHVSNCVPGLKVGKILNHIKQLLIDLKEKNKNVKTKAEVIDILNMFYAIEDYMSNDMKNYMDNIGNVTNIKNINSKCGIAK